MVRPRVLWAQKQGQGWDATGLENVAAHSQALLGGDPRPGWQVLSGYPARRRERVPCAVQGRRGRGIQGPYTKTLAFQN